MTNGTLVLVKCSLMHVQLTRSTIVKFASSKVDYSKYSGGHLLLTKRACVFAKAQKNNGPSSSTVNKFSSISLFL